mmetsp:Transcript_36941/g.106590  ORF Transcript_36941/g.106590 Transcript_36941/m.106590 type:complete len:157 (-) Transcript_36941:86-556(-)
MVRFVQRNWAHAPHVEAHPVEASSAYVKPIGSLLNMDTSDCPPLKPELPVGPRKVTITMPGPLAHGRLGLAMKDLEVLMITNPAATAYAWAVGDRVTAVNGTPVQTQEDFTAAYRQALEEHYTRHAPMVFEVYKGEKRGGGQAPASPPRQENDLFC